MKYLAVLSILVALNFGTARAQEGDPVRAPVLSGWGSRARSDGDGREAPGVIVPGSDIGFSSPAVGELDGDPSDGDEVVVTSTDGTVTALSSQGITLWSVKTPNAECGSASNRVLSSPAIGALDGNNKNYVVVGYGGFGTDCDGGVAAFRGIDGSLAWNFSLRGWAKKEKFKERFAAVFSSPGLADVDGDGKLEVGFGAFDRRVYLLEYNGKVRWYYQAADTVFSSPSFANIDKTPELEMIIGTDISQNLKINPPTSNGGILYAFRTGKPKGMPSKQYTFRNPKAFIWMRPFDQVLYSSPIVGDLLPSSPGLEIAIGSGCFFPERTTNKKGRWVKVVRAKDGKLLRTLNAPACFSSTPAVGDLDGDGNPDIVATVMGQTQIGGDGASRVVAWKLATGEKLWEITPAIRGSEDPLTGYFNSPVIGDVDGNGSLEVVFTHFTGVNIVEGSTGESLTCTEDICTEKAQALLSTGERMRASPILADVNQDGVLDIVAAGGYKGSTNGGTYVWTSLQEVITSLPGPLVPYSTPWPSFRGNTAHTGRVE